MLGAKQKSADAIATSAYDPGCVKTPTVIWFSHPLAGGFYEAFH
jgi:hypothetical protein